MEKSKDRSELLLLLLLGLFVWRYSGSRTGPKPFETVFSEIHGLTGTTYATDAGIFFLTNEKHELGPGLWFEISKTGEFIGPLGVQA